MEKKKDHALHFSLILIMFLVSAIAIQIPVEKKEISHTLTTSKNSDSSVTTRVQSLVYTGNVEAIVEGLSRYFIGSIPQSLVALLEMYDSPLNNQEKIEIMFGLVYKLRKHGTDQSMVCKKLVGVHDTLSQEPLLYAAVTSSYPDVVKDIVRWSTDSNTEISAFEAFNYAVKKNDLKAIEKLYLNGACITPEQASHLLKIALCQNKKVEIAKFFVERGHAELDYLEIGKNSLLAYVEQHVKNYVSRYGP